MVILYFSDNIKRSKEEALEKGISVGLASFIILRESFHLFIKGEELSMEMGLLGRFQNFLIGKFIYSHYNYFKDSLKNLVLGTEKLPHEFATKNMKQKKENI
jgi:hypothetical protein